MKYRKFGNTNIELSAIGLGCMSMNHGYGVFDEKEAILTLEKSIDLGINFWDTADVYANGKNEELVSKVLKSNRNKIFIATKFGFKPHKDKNFSGLDCSPDHIRLAVEGSLRRLKTDVIDLYYAHRIDPNVPIEDTVGAMAQLVNEGKVRYLGLSEASPNSIKKANKIHPISALQSEYSLMTRDVESEILSTSKELKVTFVPFSPLARAMLTNTLDIKTLPENDFRKTLPRYQTEYEENNRKLALAFADAASQKGCTPAQLALAWVLHQGDHIIPIPGTKKTKYLLENAGAVDINLTHDDFDLIESIFKKYSDTGPRYSPEHQKYVDNS
jgi:aryl-alcohol dehydrogenase-like predicted oxidoreductase